MNIDKVDKGELVYCNIEFEYQRKNFRYTKTFNKKFQQFIFSRSYDDEIFPKIDVINDSMLINKIDRKNAQYITNVKIVNLDIIKRTGYINKR